MSIKQQAEIFKLREKIKNLESNSSKGKIQLNTQLVDISVVDITTVLLQLNEKMDSVLEYLAILAEKETSPVFLDRNQIPKSKDKLKRRESPQYIPELDTKGMRIEMREEKSRVLSSDLSSSLDALDKLGKD